MKLSDEPEESDKELVLRAQSGEMEAFDQLVLRHHQRLYGLVYHMTADREDTNDLLQEIFAKVYRSLRTFKHKSSFYTWVYSIGVNMTINHLKKKGRRAASSLDDTENVVRQDRLVSTGAAPRSPRRELDLKILQEKLNAALLKLSEEHRVVVTLFDMQGVSHADISKILNISQGTVRSRLFYAHQNLQALLGEFKASLDLDHYEH